MIKKIMLLGLGTIIFCFAYSSNQINNISFDLNYLNQYLLSNPKYRNFYNFKMQVKNQISYTYYNNNIPVFVTEDTIMVQYKKLGDGLDIFSSIFLVKKICKQNKCKIVLFKKIKESK